MTEPASIADAFQPLLSEISESDIPVLLAIVERIAARHYQVWAEAAADPVERDGLLACEARENEIAEFIESLYPDAETVIAGINEKFPDLQERYEAVMAGHSRLEQLRIQSEAEAGGADLMRQFAEAHSGATAARFVALAHCEEANSKYLARLLEE